MLSYLYYLHDISVVSDVFFDRLCKDLLEAWDETEHPHKHLIDRDALSAGTGFYLKARDLPERTKSAARHLCGEITGYWPPADEEDT